MKNLIMLLNYSLKKFNSILKKIQIQKLRIEGK